MQMPSEHFTNCEIINILDNYGKSEHAECTLAPSQPPQTVGDGAVERGGAMGGCWVIGLIVPL